MKSTIRWAVVGVAFILLPSAHVWGQDPITLIIKEGIKKVIKAVDLKIQRLQNKTIWLQNAQKTLENKMQELKLGEIRDWVEKQRKLYHDYYQELWKVKSAITYYQKVKSIIGCQVQIVEEYKRALSLARQDGHFTPEEFAYMQKVYEGILHQSAENLDGLYLVINSFTTQMSDAKRLEFIDIAAQKLENNLADLRQFNIQNIRLSLQRAKDQSEIDHVKALYGLQ